MGGFFGVTSTSECSSDLFFGTDYHSHLGTQRGGMAIRTFGGSIVRHIHDIRNAPFRSKFDHDIMNMKGRSGIGAISDHEDQPLLISSHLGTYAIVTVGKLLNAERLAAEACRTRILHFAEIGGGEINPTELVASLINREATFTDGLAAAQQAIEGSCTVLLLANEGLYASRDRFGRTPVMLGRKKGGYAVSFETSAFPNLGYRPIKALGPGEIVRITPEGVEQTKPAEDTLRICAFLWVYFGYPSSHYEGINVEVARNRCGAALARSETENADEAAGIPDSGIAHAIGYATERGIPYRRPFVKYTPTWPRSFMPQDQNLRGLVAKMKLIPIPELIRKKRIVFCEDSIVRGTQLQDIVQRIHACGARAIHMRSACPPLLFGCKYLNFSRSSSILDLASRKAMLRLDGHENPPHLADYLDPASDRYAAMVDLIRATLGLTTLQYQRMDDMIDAIGLPREKLCTYCWDGCEGAPADKR